MDHAHPDEEGTPGAHGERALRPEPRSSGRGHAHGGDRIARGTRADVRALAVATTRGRGRRRRRAHPREGRAGTSEGRARRRRAGRPPTAAPRPRGRLARRGDLASRVACASDRGAATRRRRRADRDEVRRRRRGCGTERPRCGGDARTCRPSVLVVEASDRPGGGACSAELTLPGVIHDVCSAVHPLAAASPFLRSLPLAEHGLEWAHPEIDLAHPLDDGTAALLLALALPYGGIARQRRGCVALTRRAQHHSMAGDLADGLLAPADRRATRSRWLGSLSREHCPRRSWASGSRPAAAMRYSLVWPRDWCIPLSHPFTTGLALVLGVAGHVDGWPVARGGSQAIADALTSYLDDLGGELKTGGARHVARTAPRRTGAALRPRAEGSRRAARSARRRPASLGALVGFGMALASARSTMRSASLCPGPCSTCDAQAHSTSAARWLTSRTAELDVSRGQAATPPLRARLAADGVRLDSRSRGGAHPLGVLPRAGSICPRLERGDRRADRAVRSRVSRRRHGSIGAHDSRPRSVEPQPRRRRHRGRRARPPPAPRAVLGSLCSPIGSAVARTCARRRHRPVPACTACVATTRQTPRSEARAALKRSSTNA